MSSHPDSTAAGTQQTAPPNRPYTLIGDFDPTPKAALTPGDVYRSQRQEAYFRVTHTDDAFDLQREWLSTPYWGGSDGDIEPLPEEIRSWYESHDPLDLIAVDVPSRESVWFLTETVEPPVTADEAPNSTAPLSCDRVRSRLEVNHFLTHPVVGHQRGGVAGWKACFGARYQGDLVAVAVLSRPSARHSDDGTKIELSRFGSHPLRPPNTGSWLLAQAREWARLEGYDELISFSGVAGNDGTLYRALGLEAGRSTTTADGQGWENRSGRESWDSYERRKFTQELRDGTTTSQRPAVTENEGFQQGDLDDFSQGQSADSHPIKRLGLARYDTHPGIDAFFETHSPTDHPVEFDSAGFAVFVAEHQAQPLAMCVVAHPRAVDNAAEMSKQHPVSIAYAHNQRSLTAPTNTGAWLLARARDWARLEGYRELHAQPASPAHEAVTNRCAVPIAE